MNKSVFGMVIMALFLFACGTESKDAAVTAKVQDPTCSPSDTPTGASGTASVGPAGPAGPIGPIGPQGPAGKDGKDGLDGLAAAKGDTGPAGPTGPQGPQGPQGIQGPMGLTGPKGADGTSGLSIGGMYQRETAAYVALAIGANNGDTQWCNPGDIAVGGFCNLQNDATHTTSLRIGGTTVDAANNLMGYGCTGYASSKIGGVIAGVICHAP